MTEESYQRNVRRGVTGIDTDTCLLAAYDRISVRHELQPATYQAYQKLQYEYFDIVADERYVPRELVQEWRELMRAFWSELGVKTPRNIVTTRVTTPADLSRALERLTGGGFRPAVYLSIDDELHAVGVKRNRRRGYDVRSTWSPFEDEDGLAVGELFEHLSLGPRQRRRPDNGRKTDKEPNIVALPPERS